MEQKGKKILIADDDRHFTRILEDWFRSKGFEVTTAHNGKDALDLFAKVNPDVVLLDALLPKIDGFKACKEMRKAALEHEIPIIMISGIYKKTSEVQRAKEECGASAYLTKPIMLADLFKTVEDMLSH